MWRDAFGDEIDVSITPIEQGQYIGLALAGTFQAQGWRNHGGVDPSRAVVLVELGHGQPDRSRRCRSWR